jgi:hypothetical protein
MYLHTLLYGIALALRFTALLYPDFRKRLKEHDMVVQIKLENNKVGRYYIIKDGNISTKSAIHPKPDVTMFFKNRRIAQRVLTPPNDYGELVHAGKNFQMGATGEDKLVCWWMITLGKLLSSGWKVGVKMPNG